MEPKVKIYAIVITLSFFVSAALIAVVEVPNTLENVLAQQLEDSQEGSSNEDIDRTSQHRSSEDLNRIPEDEPRSSEDIDRTQEDELRENPERSSQQGQEDVLEELNGNASN
jgi:hypothetical protein